MFAIALFRSEATPPAWSDRSLSGATARGSAIPPARAYHAALRRINGRRTAGRSRLRRSALRDWWQLAQDVVKVELELRRAGQGRRVDRVWPCKREALRLLVDVRDRGRQTNSFAIRLVTDAMSKPETKGNGLWSGAIARGTTYGVASSSRRRSEQKSAPLWVT